MEKPPTIKYEKVEQEQKEVSPEKRSQMWKILRTVSLTGILAFNGMKAVEQMREGTAEREQSKITEQARNERAEYNKAEKQREQERQEFLDATTIARTDFKLPYIEDGKIIKEAIITTKDGRMYETRAEIDIATSQLADEDPEVLKEKVKYWKPGSEVPAWNTNIISRTAEDGSGFKVLYTVTEDGLEMTIQELGSGGQLVNSRTVLTQEKTSS